MSAGNWHRVAGLVDEPAHVFLEPAKTRCDRALAQGEELTVRDLGEVSLCNECCERIFEDAALSAVSRPPAPPVERCGCACCAKSSVAIAYRRELAIATAEWLADEPHAGALVQGHDEEGAT